MIIDDAHRFAFMHIPKCGGTSVRRQLEAIDAYEGEFWGRKIHPRLGEIDYCHLPLAFLKSDFPAEFEKVRSYDAFALVRDPHSRFVSATFERLALFGGVRRTTATARDALRMASETIRWLRDRDSFCDAAYIHFARQSDYIRLDGRTVVQNVFALEDLGGFGAAVQGRTGVDFDPGRRENANFASSNRLLTLLHAAKPFYSRVTTWERREKILQLMRRLNLQSPKAIYAEFGRNPEVKAFVREYYREDFELYRVARARMSQSAPATADAVAPGSVATGVA